ncbi:uncharacterized protein F5891DRAFT_1276433 [Suillus fuscotomentosus]|uniref:Protein prenyltransferase alpha subunit repeat-containing protein 1 n=1 Tax=Suillus fuscotomentosus TaxID=1912939 RepID=A0AAD4EBS1_9AGAM|nr:uncharacterized protein F5891DRAFT_1276433 [Suillus fuscotomentosus]KAG1903261.1 hypothetical protein F5891DRAFT_1276433 [Suillus fuscotomentosus]
MTDASVSTCFRSLTSLLLKPPATIEVLPGDASIWIPDVEERSRSPFLFTENNLGVPEKELRRSYLFAVPVFSAARKASEFHTLEDPSNHIMSSAIQDLIDSSAVLILMNPAHQTALNARKQLIVRNLIDMGEELKFTAALLSSRHCCKQGELWYHRQWLLRRIYPVPSFPQGLITDMIPDSPNFYLPPNDLSAEIHLVSRACELYPRNYFGWTHRTICILSALVSGRSAASCSGLSLTSPTTVLFITLKHSQRLTEDAESPLLPDRLHLVFGHALTLVRAFPEHETLWQYLRVFWDESDVATAFVTSFVLPLQSPRMTEQESESPSGVQHACRFLEWRNQRLK